MSTEKKLEKEIETLDQEARASLDKLADRRVELERLHRRTELAQVQRREREEEVERKAQEKQAAEAKAAALEQYHKFAAERYDLEAKAEEAMTTLLDAIDRLLPLEGRQNQAAHGGGLERNNELQPLIQHWLETRLSQLLPQVSEFHEIYRKPLCELDVRAVKDKA